MVWPVIVGAPSYDYSDQQLPAVMPPPPPPAQPAPPVIINQNFGPATQPAAGEEDSNVHLYQAPAPQQAAPAEERPLFFIALKDSSVYTAVAYWVEDGTLHYITPQGKHNQVSLDLVDRGVSGRLNAGRNVQFHLPG